MAEKPDSTKRKPLLPIRFTGLYGKRPTMETTAPLPEPAKVEAPVEPTATPKARGRFYGKESSPENTTKGVENFKKKV